MSRTSFCPPQPAAGSMTRTGGSLAQMARSKWLCHLLRQNLRRRPVKTTSCEPHWRYAVSVVVHKGPPSPATVPILYTYITKYWHSVSKNKSGWGLEGGQGELILFCSIFFFLLLKTFRLYICMQLHHILSIARCCTTRRTRTTYIPTSPS